MIPLEDNAADIIGKAQRGLGISDSQLAERSGLSADAVRKLRGGDFDEQSIRRIAPLLNLNPDALAKLAAGHWTPEEIPELAGLALFNTNYGDMTVNAYLLWDPATRDAVAFDTGADCTEMLRRAAREDLTIKSIMLTHSHPDHVADLERLRSETGAVIYVSEHEFAPGAETIAEGERFRVGALQIETRLTSGHSPGGITYLVTGLARPVAVVGDSLFAASMGGGAVSYEDAIRNNLEKILTQPEETIVCPGHGPLTTVGKERRENPFFASQV
jgi:glyoxylase-like metal-dependent hydrolase (beta-lactamase superfamily II)